MRPLRRLLFLIAVGFGSGYAPVVPGTFGTLAAIPVQWLVARSLTPAGQIGFVVLFTALAIWAAEVASRRLDEKDPRVVVVDEWAGYFITVAALPPGWRTAASGFLLFRILDIVKPFPARRLERLPGGFGIVLDDVMAGLFGNLLLRLAVPLLS